jgi:prepilin-type N-terminal cleavage/methylation domain-containing protein
MRSRGFTLIELLIVVGLIATLLVVATARFDRIFTRTRLEAGARGVADHFAYAIRSAYTAGSYKTLVLDLRGNGYSIKTGRESGESAPILRRRLPAGVKFTDVQVGHDTYTPPGILSIEVSPLGITNDVLVNLEDESKGARAVWMQSLVQGVRYFDEYTSYEDLQESPE